VLVDGKAADLGGPAVLTGAGPSLRVRVRVAGAKRLTLAVRQAGFGDVQAHVNWADARLIKSPLQ
jgi:hypothetical protein